MQLSEWQLFEPGTVPEWTTPEWYAGRERAPHLEQAAHRERLKRAALFVDAAAKKYDLSTAVDLGAGDGGLLWLLTQPRPWVRAWGYDLAPANVAGAKQRGVDVRLGDVVGGDVEWGDIAIATEMLEHLVDPKAFVRRIAEHSRVIVASSPGWETGESHYEFHTWAWDWDGYKALIEQGGFQVARHEDAGGFQVMMGVRP